MNNAKKDITIIGNSVIDVLTAPVSAEVFKKGSHPVKNIKLSFGGDALNEAVILSRFGKRTELITKTGDDDAGERIRKYLIKNHVGTNKLIIENGLETSVSIVLIDETGERVFLSNPQGSQRKLTAKDILPHLDTAADIVSFASIFVSTDMDIPSMRQVFQRIKSHPGRILAADITKAKHGESLEDLKPLLPYVDYIFPNTEEAALLTGASNPEKNADLLVRAGAGCAVVKCGAAGCVLRTAEKALHIPAYPVKKCIDTTGAGDSFAAGFLWALSEGYPAERCAEFACAAASCAIECIGASDGLISIEEPLRRYHGK